jgi:hypothetical protein
MIPYVDDCYFISRKDNVIFANLTHGDQVPLVRLKQNFIDLNILEGQALKYMEKYMEMFPQLWEYIKEEKKENEQLTLF